ncbi:MAG: amidohydrolase family protein [Armatimonadia bacterium]
MHTGEALQRVGELRNTYRSATAALPWLDACRDEDDPPAFPTYATDLRLPAVPRALAGTALPSSGPLLAAYAPQCGPLETVAADCARTRTPLVIRHTDIDLPRLGDLAQAHPALPLVIESGPLKLLYHIAVLERLLQANPNLWLCTYNLCNWLGLERLCAAGVGHRLLFGTHGPRYDAHVSMAPVALAQLTWDQKCDLAGNNLRRLLGLSAVSAPQPSAATCDAPAAFIIDSHGHNGPPGKFPTPDEHFAPADWLRFMDGCAIERLYLTPMAAIDDPAGSSRQATSALLEAAPDRFRYYAVFHPGGDVERLGAEVDNPLCAGIKIHPSMHGVPADSPAYRPAFELSARVGKPVLTHSWENSPTNPTQHLSHPKRFEVHLRACPGARLILGHAGGRPSTAETVADLCRRYPQVVVDLAGDYFDSGLVAMLCDRIGPRRVLFASDMNWIDPRCLLGAVLGSRLSDDAVLGCLRGNALSFFGQ